MKASVAGLAAASDTPIAAQAVAKAHAANIVFSIPGGLGFGVLGNSPVRLRPFLGRDMGDLRKGTTGRGNAGPSNSIIGATARRYTCGVELARDLADFTTQSPWAGFDPPTQF